MKAHFAKPQPLVRIPVNNIIQNQGPGKVSFNDGKVVRSGGPNLFYEIPAEEIKVIGEFTTADGPWFDDWFLTIITKNDWYEIPMDAAGLDELLTDLSKRLGVNLNWQFVGSTKWKTRIMYPESVKDKELYKLVDVEPKSLWYWIKKMFGLQKRERQFSDTTLAIVAGKSTTH